MKNNISTLKSQQDARSKNPEIFAIISATLVCNAKTVAGSALKEEIQFNKFKSDNEGTIYQTF